MGCIIDIEPPPGALVRFISDLHLGHERCEAPAVSELAPLLRGVSILVVVGDLAETRKCDWQEAGIAAREELRQLCRARGVQLVEISGNHDPDVPALLARFWGGRVVAMHGHALHKEVAPWSWEYLRNKAACKKLIAEFPGADDTLECRLELSRSMCQLTPPIMRREGIRNPLLRGFMHCFWPPQRPIGIVWSWLTCGIRCEHFIRRFLPETQITIFGHLHRGGHWRFGKRQILNTGAWFRHATPYVVDIADAQLIRYTQLTKLLEKAKS
jgi:exonuclease SbcD